MYGTEAAIDGWRLAVLSGDTARAERYRNAAVLGAQFLKRLQFREGDTDRYAQGEMMIGGVPYGLARPILRVDITRHLINTFFKIVTYLDHEEYPAKGKLDGLPNPPTFDTLDMRE